MQLNPVFFGLPPVEHIAIPEAVFDVILAILGIPAGVYLFYRAFTDDKGEK